jgi:protein-tyrosine phosphatase
LGNICRSPSAEAILARFVKGEGLEKVILIDSAGTSDYHVGEKADPRASLHAKKRGIELTSIARHFSPRKDFKEFDYILAMDKKNLNDLHSLDTHKKFGEKIHLITKFGKKNQFEEVPDPYYSGEKGFELVLDILEDCCIGLLEKIKDDLAN